ASSYDTPSRSPVPRCVARSIVSRVMFAASALSIAVRRRGFVAGSPPPMRAAVVISRISFVNSLPRFASWAFFRCWMFAHFEWPAMSERETHADVDAAVYRDGRRRVEVGVGLAVA